MLTDLGAVLRGVPGEELAEHGAALRVHRLRGHQRVERQLAQQIQRRNQALLHPLDIRTHNQRTSVERQLAQQLQRRNQALLHPLDIRTHNQRTSVERQLAQQLQHRNQALLHPLDIRTHNQRTSVERQLAQQLQHRNQALLHPLDIRTHNQRTSPRIFCVVIGKRLDEKMITLAVVKSKVWFGK
jgi:hypothetical protein